MPLVRPSSVTAFCVSAGAPASFGLRAPGIAIPLSLEQTGAQGFDLRVKLTGIHGEFDTLLLRLRELLAQFAVLNHNSEELGSALAGVVHAVLCPAGAEA